MRSAAARSFNKNPSFPVPPRSGTRNPISPTGEAMRFADAKRASASFLQNARRGRIQSRPKKNGTAPKKCALRAAFLSRTSLVVQFGNTKIGGFLIWFPPISVLLCEVYSIFAASHFLWFLCLFPVRKYSRSCLSRGAYRRRKHRVPYRPLQD